MYKYFKHFPVVNYPSHHCGKFTQNIEVVDMTVRFKIDDIVANNENAYYYYKWEDNDRPDVVAQKYYGDPDLAWLVMLQAEPFDWVYDFPMSIDLFEAYICDKYNVDEAYKINDIVHHYEDAAGYTIDYDTYIEAGAGKRIVTAYMYEEQLNESRRVIRLLSKVYVDQITTELRDNLRSIKRSRKELGYNG